MTDKELLELAAKAVSLKLAQGYGQPPEKCLFYCDDDGCHDWNPLDDDGDALELAVTLEMDIRPTRKIQTVYIWCDALDKWIGEYYGNGGNRYAATRRAIVRAAAEIGRSMK